MTAVQFFKKNPLAPVCYVVGDQVFNAGSLGAARDHAATTDQEVEEAVNPGGVMPVVVADPAVTNPATTHDGQGAGSASTGKLGKDTKDAK